MLLFEYLDIKLVHKYKIYHNLQINYRLNYLINLK